MKVRIKTAHGETLAYETPGACAFDFQSTDEVTIEPGEFALIETWTVIETPKWYLLQIQPRSSTFKKFGLIQVNSVGIIDNDYCGDNDTVKFPYMNMRKETVTIPAGTRIWQWVFVKIERAEFELVETMGDHSSRWGFWTTWN